MNKKTAVFLLMTIFILVPAPVLSADLWVASTGNDTANDCRACNNPCLTLQHAADQAASKDRICVVQGTYVENLTLDRTIAKLTVRGGYSCSGGKCVHTPDPTLTIVDGAALGQAIEVRRFLGGASTVRLEYLTIRNGSYGGLFVYGSQGSPAHVTVADSVIADNSTSGYGGGLSLQGQDVTLEIIDSTIRNNTALSGGGVSAVCGPAELETGLHLILKRNHVLLNQANGSGGGIYIENKNPLCRVSATLEGNIIGHANIIDPIANPQGNSAGYGGGISVNAGYSSLVDFAAAGNTINANNASQSGGAVSLESYDSGHVKGVVKNNIFSWNSAAKSGGALKMESYNGGKQAVSFHDNFVTLNDGPAAGVSLEAWLGAEIAFDMARCWVIFNGNSASEGALEVFADDPDTLVKVWMNSSYLGANARGIDIQSSDSALVNLYMTNTLVVNHTTGNGIRLHARDVVTGKGGTVKLVSVNNTIANNQKGIFLTSRASGGIAQAALTNSIVWGNSQSDIFLTEDDSDGEAASSLSARHSDIGILSNSAPPNDGTYENLGNNISQDPLFVDPVNGNFELSPGPPLSPAADAGICGQRKSPGEKYVRIAPFVDFERDPRPPAPTTDFLCDMGADEIDHCVDKTRNLDETGVDCGGDRCAPCACTTAQHAQRTCGAVLTPFPDIAAAYLDIQTSGVCEIASHRMEFTGGLGLTKKSPDGKPIEVTLSGGWNCAMTMREEGDATTVRGPVTIGGDTVIEADRLIIR